MIGNKEDELRLVIDTSDIERFKELLSEKTTIPYQISPGVDFGF